jgi:hypothetical protein
MPLTLDLPPALEEALRRESVSHGMDAEDYAVRLIEQHLPVQTDAQQSLWERLTPEEWRRRADAWIETHRDWPIPPPEAFERASFYEGRD